MPTQLAGGAAIRFLVAPPGELDDMRGVEEAEAVEGVQRVLLYREPGHVFRELRRASDRAGAVLAVGATGAAALAAADEAARRIRFVTHAVEVLA